MFIDMLKCHTKAAHKKATKRHEKARCTLNTMTLLPEAVDTEAQK